METKLKLPALPGGAANATISGWSVSPGAVIEAGQTLALIESEQGVIELEAAEGGVIGKILIEAGATVEPGTELAVISNNSSEAAEAPQASALAEPAGGVIEILMPKAGNDVEECTLMAWKVAEGDKVEKGQVIFEIETDKSTIEVEAEDEGVIQRIVVRENDLCPVLAPVALIAGSAADADAWLAAKGAGAPAAEAVSDLPDPAGPVTPILMPKAGNDVEECTLMAWKVAEGDKIEQGQVIFEIETDKSTIEVEAEDEGVIQRIVVRESDLCPVLAPVAVIAGSAEDADRWLAKNAKVEEAAPAAPAPAPAAPAAAPAPAPAPAATRPPASPAARRMATESGFDLAAVTQGSGPGGRILSTDLPRGAGRIAASPAARRMAAQRGVDLSAIGLGSGPAGRILTGDVEAAAARMPTPATQVLPAEYAAPGLDPAEYAPAPKAPVTTEIKPLSGMRKAIARNLTNSKQTVPHFYMKLTFEADRFMAFRKAQKAICGATVNDVLVLAMSRAMARVPQFRCQWSDDGLVQFSGANIGVAVSLPDGLRVPSIVGVDQMTLAELVAETKAAVAATREGKAVNPGKSTLTISNLGMSGVEEFTAIINPPEAGILAVGGVSEGVKVSSGAIKAVKQMTMWLSSDHRIVDGSVAAEFCAELKKVLETPEVLR